MCYLVKCADYFVVHLLYSLFFVCLVCMLLKKIQESPILIVILPIYSFHSVNYISKYVLLPFLNFDVYIFIEGASHYNHENSLFNSVSVQFSSVQLLSCVRLFATSWTAARQATLSITNSPSLPKLMSIESVMPSSNLILCHPLLLLPPTFLSIRVFSNESALHIRWPKYWSFSFNISPSSEHSGLISFRMDCWISLQSKGLSRVFSNTTLQKHQFSVAQLSLQSNSHIHT